MNLLKIQADSRVTLFAFMCLCGVLTGCDSQNNARMEEKQRRIESRKVELPELGEFVFETMNADSSHEYGAGDCFGEIFHYSGEGMSLAVDSVICSEYSYTFTHYLFNEAELLTRVYQVSWRSEIMPELSEYSHILTETAYLTQPLRKLVRSDTLGHHYLESGKYPPPILKDFRRATLTADEFEKIEENYRSAWKRSLIK